MRADPRLAERVDDPALADLWAPPRPSPAA
jgi:hypothetical protein